MRIFILGVILWATVWDKECFSQPIQDIYRLTEEVTLDGILSEKAWQEITPFPMTQYEPRVSG